MADDEKGGEGNSSRGADWEVVSLTASAYAAAPSPGGFSSPDESRDLNFDKNEHVPSDPMFMSGHFVFPPSEHENLPIEHFADEIQNEPGGEDIASILEEGENHTKAKSKTDESLHGIQMFDSGEQLSVHPMEFGGGKSLHGLSFVGKEDIMYSSSEFGALHADTDISMANPCDESADTIEPNDPSQRDVDSAQDTDALKLNRSNKNDGSGLPCEAWWKRHAASWYSHAKEGNTFWSVFVAAALMGLVILGKRWHRENLQLQQLKWQFNINAERVKWMTGPINRFKDILVGSHQRSLLLRAEAIPNHQVL
ncbi:hypothetical protein J5N97_023554 [Dioscorea zingiberensis]|uniref:ATG8-interacting protein 1 n=1 Tax=Dioscorea zingiberensis TaxID=325984 RepID=A0A9D5C503_9LILI|nr:hypothetical protein J5N97_023554 [Dioscorea zingiberensis]